MNNRIALFDFDGTLTTKDTFIEFGLFAVGKMNFCKALIRNVTYLAGWELGIIPNYKAKEKLFGSLFKGMTLEEFNGKCEAFSRKIDTFLHPVGYDKMKTHLKEGTPVYIVSASIENWIKPWARNQGVTDVVSTKIEVNEYGKLTGRFASKNCYGPEKVNRIKDVCKEIESSEIWAYGDSKGDDDMLKFSDHHAIIK